MRFNFRLFVLAPAVLAAAALATTSAMAETRVNVPFNFTVDGKTCPAGQYVLLRDPAHNFITLLGKNAPVGFNWILGPGDGKVKESNLTLSFARQDQGYALESIQFGSLTTHKLDKKTPGTEHKTVQIVEGR